MQQKMHKEHARVEKFKHVRQNAMQQAEANLQKI